MAKTLDDLQHLLTRQGYACELLLDTIVATRVETKTYKNPAGENALEILLTFDQPNDCVAVEILHAFDLRKTDHKEATLACLMTASGRTPLLRAALEPEGDIKIRIDCQCDAEGARDADVIRALVLLPAFAEAWHEQITMAMEKGKFDANKVAHLNLSRMRDDRSPQPPADSPAADPDQERSTEGRADLLDLMRAATILRKPGAGPNRLRAIFEFQQWLDERDGNSGNQN